MLKKVRIKNFRGIQDSGEIDFMPGITVLVGQNESGKTSILEAINYFGKFFRHSRNPFETNHLDEDVTYQSSKVQTAEFTYSTNKQFQQRLKKLVEEINSKKEWIQEDYSFNLKKLKNIKEYTVSLKIDYTKTNNLITVNVKDCIFQLISNFWQIKKGKENQINSMSRILTPHLVGQWIWLSSPQIILFDAKYKLLPDKITIPDLRKKNRWTDGYYGVKNLEAQMGIDFCEMNQKTKIEKNNLIESLSNELTVNFQKVWKQEIHTGNKIKIKFDIEKNVDMFGEEEECVKFYVSSKEDQYLPPRERSAGMIWFLSFWLELMSHKNSNENLIFLFDEPGNNLHNTGCEDVLNVFKELTEKNHQIIFSTHRPNLITKELQRLRIVVNDEKKGIIVEPIFKSKVGERKKRDALYSVIVSMGLSPGKEMGILSKKSVILQEISNYFYFKGMKHILKRNNTYKFVPQISIKFEKIMSLIYFCIGYGIKFVVILDQKYYAEKIEKTLKKEFPEIIKNQIILLPEQDIEEMFSVKDLKLISPQINIKNQNNNLEIIGEQNKANFAEKFLNLVKNNEINEANLDSKTIKKFKLIFSDLEKKLKENN